jgi:hypothetical protein
MDDETFRARLRAREQELGAASPRQTVARFLRSYCSGADGLDEVRADVSRTVASHPEPVRRYLGALDALLAEPPSAGSLARLVALDANWALDDPSDAGARAWLEALAALIRGALDEPEGAGEGAGRA